MTILLTEEGGQYSHFKEESVHIWENVCYLSACSASFALSIILSLTDMMLEWWLLVYGKWCTDHWPGVPHLQQKGNEQARFRTSCLVGARYEVAERNLRQNLSEIHMYSYKRLGHLLKSCPGFTSICSTVHFGRITNEGAVFMTASCELDIFTTSCKLFTRKLGNVFLI